MPEERSRCSGIACPTISEVLAQFLREQHGRLSPRTFPQYHHVVQLLEHYLNSYGPSSLSSADRARYERLHAGPDHTPREFCEIFGPNQILGHVSMFISDFLVRKVAPGRELVRASGTVAKRLAWWLAENGHVDPAGRDRKAPRSWQRHASRPSAIIAQHSARLVGGACSTDQNDHASGGAPPWRSWVLSGRRGPSRQARSRGFGGRSTEFGRRGRSGADFSEGS